MSDHRVDDSDGFPAGVTQDNIPLPRWRSHKIVEAAKIIELFVSRLGKPMVRVESPDGDETKFVTISVPNNFAARGVPGAGDYFVRYEGDGYVSWSPAAVFEDGYTRIEPSSG